MVLVGLWQAGIIDHDVGCCQLQPENDEDEDKEEEDALVSCEMLSEVVYVEGFEENGQWW